MYYNFTNFLVLIQEIYSKQKQRDQAMMGRLKLANEERDRANAMVKALQDGQSMYVLEIVL